MRKLGCFFKALRNRKLTSRGDLRDDLRKLGRMDRSRVDHFRRSRQLDRYYSIPRWFDLLFFGLTQPTESQTFEDHNNE